MFEECYDHIMVIANDRKLGNYQKMNEAGSKVYLAQVTKLLKVIFLATKELEGDDLSTSAKVIPTILNTLLELEEPEVN